MGVGIFVGGVVSNSTIKALQSPKSQHSKYPLVISWTQLWQVAACFCNYIKTFCTVPTPTTRRNKEACMEERRWKTTVISPHAPYVLCPLLGWEVIAYSVGAGGGGMMRCCRILPVLHIICIITSSSSSQLSLLWELQKYKAPWSNELLMWRNILTRLNAWCSCWCWKPVQILTLSKV